MLFWTLPTFPVNNNSSREPAKVPPSWRAPPLASAGPHWGTPPPDAQIAVAPPSRPPIHFLLCYGVNNLQMLLPATIAVDFRDHRGCKPAPSSDGACVWTSRPCWPTSLLSRWRGWPPPPYPHTQSDSGILWIPTACFGDRWSPRWLQITNLVYFSLQTSLHFLLLFLSDPPPVLSVFYNPGHGHQL